ncbi:OmpA family protein [Qipengyuania vesicularis]|uniref:OmpA family protein n=1 Tax=Qipengyuania vesicularis TaxID=2867232 RepID=UPI001C885E82|nr:OmpA family protein [Qipengyuania vesicularis]MBX7528338.1 OmpA family protein [Qipengyuania vesicularis]
MSSVKESKAACLLFAGVLILAGCKVNEAEPEPEASPTDGPRSIFQQDPADGGVAPAPTLPPLEMTLSFADGTPELTEAVRAELATIVDSPQVEAGGPIVLRGHSDSQGSDEENLDSSRERAEAVRDFLVESGISASRIRVIAFGEQNPIAPNALPDGSPNEEGRAQNRRVEVTVVTGRSGERQQTLIETLSNTDEEASAAARTGGSPQATDSPAQ